MVRKAEWETFCRFWDEFFFIFYFFYWVLQPPFSNTSNVTPDCFCGSWYIHHTEAPLIASTQCNCQSQVRSGGHIIHWHVQRYVNDELSAARSADTLIIFFIRLDALCKQPLSLNNTESVEMFADQTVFSIFLWLTLLMWICE